MAAVAAMIEFMKFCVSLQLSGRGSINPAWSTIPKSLKPIQSSLALHNRVGSTNPKLVNLRE